MKVDVVMPKMGESVNEGTIIKWHKKVGDKVEKDEIIFEISTDKVDTEIPSPEDGVLIEIKAQENETVEVDTVVAVIDTEGEAGAGKEEEKQSEETENKEEEKSAEENKEDDKKEEVESAAQADGELIDVVMPKMGESVVEGTIIKWHKKVGDKVEKDEIIFEISTDKVDTEIPSPEDGTLAEILHRENETVEAGEVVARISLGGGVVKKKEKEAEPQQDKKIEDKDAAAPEAEEKEEAPGRKKEGEDSSKFYSPLVMSIAEKEGVSFDELESIEGTGLNGRVTKKDILNYIENGRKGKKTAEEVKKKETVERKKTAPVKAGEGVEVIPMDNVRKRIMYHMVNSRDTSVHVTTVIEVDVTKIHNFIKENKKAYMEKDGLKLTYMPFICHAAIKALKEFPYLNASIDGDNILVKRYINLGIAVAVEPNGLIVPNIRNADEKNLRGLTKSLMEIGNKARNKKLAPDDIMDGTFTITNYGIFGSLFGTPVINQPEVAILGVGAVTKKPVVIEVDGVDTIAVKPMMYLSLSHDHRLVDGMLGGKFLKKIKEDLENFDISIF